MYQGKRSALVLLLAGVFVGLLSLVACGGGGSSSSGGTLPQTSIAPTATLEGWTPNDSTLVQYKTYTFAASATDPNIGGSISEFRWDFGDGSTKTTPVVLSGGKATTTATYSYVTSGTPVLSVVAKNAAGLLSTAATRPLTVGTSPSPLTVTFTSPTAPMLINAVLGNTVTLTYKVNVVYTGFGTVSASGVTLDPGEAGAIKTAPADAGSGSYTIAVTYAAATTMGSRTVTPTVKVVDSNNVSSSTVTGPVITIKTVSATNTAPIVTLASNPEFPAGPNATWQNVLVTFTATASDPDSDPLTYTWDFGDGTVLPGSTDLTQTHKYANAGLYSVKVTADDGRAGGTKTADLTLNVLVNRAPTVVVSKTLPVGNPTKYQPVTLSAAVTDLDLDLPTVTWDFGDGSAPVTGTPVVHQFQASGVSTVAVIVDDGKGGKATGLLLLTVVENNPPVASVTTPAASLYQKKVYTFTATASDLDAGDTIASYQWDFGDGVVVAGGASQTHTFPPTVAGPVAVRARAIDSRGAVGDWSPAVTFTVLATSLPSGTFLTPAGTAAYNTEVGATGVVITYIVSMSNPNGIGFLPVTALTFDPGEAAASVLTQIANGDGTYTYQVSYKPTAAAGSRLVVPSVIATDLQGITGLANPGGPVTINTQTVNTPPVILFTAASAPSAGPNATWQGVAFTFSGTATDADSDPLTYTLTFGDTGGVGNVATTPVPTGGAIAASHTYSAAGVYTATLTVSDGRTNGTKTIALNLTVIANAAPTLSIATSPSGTTPFAYVPVTFTATVGDANGDPWTLTWNFGDGSGLVTGQNPVTHTFTAAGTTTVKATADDGKGGVTITNLVLTVQSNRPPVSQVTTLPSSLNQNKVYAFAATATDPDAGDSVTQYEWDFGDGTALQSTPTGATSHTYASTFTGPANVKVRATDSRGAVGDWSPAVAFTVVPTQLPVVTFLAGDGKVFHASVGGNVVANYLIQVANPNGTGFLPVANVVATSADGTVGTLMAHGDGTYTLPVIFLPLTLGPQIGRAHV